MEKTGDLEDINHHQLSLMYPCFCIRWLVMSTLHCKENEKGWQIISNLNMWVSWHILGRFDVFQNIICQIKDWVI